MEIIHEIEYYDTEKKKKSKERWGYYGKDGKFIYHNELNKPSDIRYYSNGEFFVRYERHDILHRIDGAAYILYNKDSSIIYKKFYLNGSIATEEEVIESKHAKDINDLILG